MALLRPGVEGWQMAVQPREAEDTTSYSGMDWWLAPSWIIPRVGEFPQKKLQDSPITD